MTEPEITLTETSGASPDAPEENTVVLSLADHQDDVALLQSSDTATMPDACVTEPFPNIVTNEELDAALLLAQSNEALEEKPFVTENVPIAMPITLTKKSYTLEIHPDITPAEAAQLALFCFAQVLAQNPEVGITVNGMKFENFARHFKEMV